MHLTIQRKEVTRMHNLIAAFSDSLYFGMIISLIGYGIGVFLKDRTRLAIANPILIGLLVIIGVLKLLDIDYETYMKGAQYISYLLTPATVCLAIPLYEKIKLLKDNLAAILIGIATGVVTNAIVVWTLCELFTLDDTIFATMLPKSITTAIGMAVSAETGGIETITVALICISGIVGNVVADIVCRICRIRNPIAKGIAIGNSSHVLGTAKAVELGEIEGAMSGLSVAVSGILTVIIAPFLV